jgi:hypothetical protein
MKKLLFVLTVIGILQGCSKVDNTPPLKLEKPIIMSVFCPNAINDTISKTDYEYDFENLTKLTLWNYGEITSVTNYEYNSKNLLIKETRDQDLRKTEITYVYNKSDQLINKLYKIADLDANGLVLRTNESETPLEYKNNLLFKDLETWGGWNTYEYSDGKLTTKNIFTSSGQIYWILKFKYSGNLKVEEKNQTASGNIIYNRTFEYDSESRLVKTIEAGNVIEQNIYDGNKLLEKRIYYFGIDPGFSACNGNFIYKYDYL